MTEPLVIMLDDYHAYLYLVRDQDHKHEVIDKHMEGSREDGILLSTRDVGRYGQAKAAQMYMAEHNIPGGHLLDPQTPPEKWW